jgi:hypothetical protein
LVGLVREGYFGGSVPEAAVRVLEGALRVLGVPELRAAEDPFGVKEEK